MLLCAMFEHRTHCMSLITVPEVLKVISEIVEVIFVYNPYVTAGGGQRIQGAFIKILNSATDADIHTFTNL